ncbi:signal sequence receptor alpha [Grosmannia clavigera kw1407]|uniref:Signal recognition particle receptor subunit alpha homolog n=1 Tax=Grosmannia clavigera (strain kw1407 / UAMH 11150) TaxID=655863 RepID=F0XK27_GROCL|nr:signal sequence receptor alpha [Grosmannia clavigera kw1407]EFX02004.1 signal sequence receptor alpha [Grosmannia clavigera kw1407]
MLDSFEIVTTSGVVLWSRNYAFVSPAIVNKFITDVFIEENASGAVTKEEIASGSSHAPYLADQYAVKWAFVKDLGIIFVAVYKSLLHLSWIDKLVENIKTIFASLYGEQLTRPHTTIVECARFDNYFDQQMNELEGGPASTDTRPLKTDAARPKGVLTDDNSAGSTPIDTPVTSRPSTPGGSGSGSTDAAPRFAGGSSGTTTSAQPSPLAKVSRRARKAHHVAAAGTSYSSDEAVRKQQKDKTAKTAKKGRKWGADGMADEEDDIQLDYSTLDAADKTTAVRSSALEQVDAATWGSKTSKGQFVLKDLDSEVHSILADAAASKKAASQAKAEAAASTSGAGGLLGSGLSTIGGLFRNVVGGKTLTREDLDKAMKGMEDHLLRKNVAREAAVRLCESVEADLVGVKTGNFESTNARVKTALEAALTKMLTPTSSLDLLREIDAVTAPPVTSLRKPRPYVISIVGVNGVGKSTNLSKICFFLLQNRYRVLIAAGDTFRSGAVEQLAVHVRNLQELTSRDQNGSAVELYQRGYGKDAAAVAKDAVAFAAQKGFDVVLIDTAGRRHNDQRLMSSLEKFAKFAHPDKILMVGEALVGTDSVAQARSFNSAFGSNRSLDGFIISKCDTVGGMVGTLVSLVHATNVPILFVGVGQHYSDLRNFSVKWAVERLLSND